MRKMAKLLIRLWWRSMEGGESRFLKLMKWKIKFIELKNSVCWLFFLFVVLFRDFFHYTHHSQNYLRKFERVEIRKVASCLPRWWCVCVSVERSKFCKSLSFQEVFTETTTSEIVRMSDFTYLRLCRTLYVRITHISRQFAVIRRTHTVSLWRTHIEHTSGEKLIKTDSNFRHPHHRTAELFIVCNFTSILGFHFIRYTRYFLSQIINFTASRLILFVDTFLSLGVRSFISYFVCLFVSNKNIQSIIIGSRTHSREACEKRQCSQEIWFSVFRCNTWHVKRHRTDRANVW